MSPATLLAFAGVSLLLAVTPGPDMAVVTRNALAYGRRGVLLTTTGIALALLVHITASSFGLSALLRASALLFDLLKIAGGLYLAYLGVRAWWETRHPLPALDLDERHAAAPAAILRTGFLSAVSNPKLLVFFLTFIPQWVDTRRPVLPQMLILGVLFAAIGWAWMNAYGLLVDRVRSLITAPRVRRWMERVTGTVLIGLGGRLLLERI
jgi:threonine/homoserine/homoserine lactone efflux protein